MAISEGTEALTLTKLDRAWRIEVFIADDDTVGLRFHRERAWYLNGAIRNRNELTTTQRTQTQIAAKSYTAGGVTRTGNQILALLNQMADDERAVDVAAGKP